MIRMEMTGLLAAVMIVSLTGVAQAKEPVPLNDTRTAVGRGALIYAAHCATCHDNSKHMLNDNGPALFGVVNRRVGSLADYDYSAALQKGRDHRDRWTLKRLDTFLSNPEAMYPGTTMPMNFSDRDHRASIIAYLNTLKD